ncbi:astacin-like metalloprotease toxin 4 [Dermacentor albipictus]|uniref:astacin-like metalloprotease toxin 4 n=1 Tax=Dermacentor albipictus TaxID=60249 RepID=UPI0038FC65F4
MHHIEQSTCIRFVKRTNEKDYVRIAEKEGCYSMVGRIGGEQPLSLGRGCLFRGTVMHELLHVLGFYHEQNRPDRDEYIDIFPENVKNGFLPQFDKLPAYYVRRLTQFSYKSIMLYGSGAFSRAANLSTMLKKDGGRLEATHDKDTLSPLDVVRIDMLYPKSCA